MNLATQQRAIFTGGSAGGSVGVSLAATDGDAFVTLSASAIDDGALNGLNALLIAADETLLSGWEFSFSGGEISAANPAYLSFYVGEGFAIDELSLWHYDGSEWTEYAASDLSYDGQYASFTVTGFSGYAVSAVPEPSAAALLLVALLSLAGYARRRLAFPKGKTTMRRFSTVYIVSVACLSMGLVAPAQAGMEGCGASQPYLSYYGGFGDETYHDYGNQPAWGSTPSIDWTHTFTGNGGNTSTAQWGSSYWGNSHALIYYFAPDMGLTQYAPAGGNDPAEFKIEWFVNAEGGGGPLLDIKGWYNIPVLFTVSDGGFVEFQMETTYYGWYWEPNPDFGPSSPIARFPEMVYEQTLSCDKIWDAPGTHEETLQDCTYLASCLRDVEGLGYGWSMSGTITFTVKNDSGPVGISFPEGLSLGFQGTAVPESSCAALLLVALLSLAGYARRRRRSGCA